MPLPQIASSNVPSTLDAFRSDPADWNALPGELQLKVCKLLGLSDLKQLRLVSHHWRDGVEFRLKDLRRCEAHCAAWIERMESNAWCDPPRIDPIFADNARALASRFPDMALALNLQQVRAALAAGATFPVTHQYCDLRDLNPDMALWSVVRMPAGEPLFVASVEVESDRPAIVVCAPDGTRRMPDVLRGFRPVIDNQAGDATLQGASVTAGRLVLPVQRIEDGRIALYLPDTDQVEALPEQFVEDPNGHLPHVSLSADARFVAAVFERGLRIYDRVGGELVEHDRGMADAGFSVDSRGDVFAGEPDVWDDDEDAWAQPLDGQHRLFTFNRATRQWQVLPDVLGHGMDWLTLSPDERYLVKAHGDSVVIADRRAPDIAIELRGAPDRRFRPGAMTAGISRAGMFMAVAYGNQSIGLFDLTGSKGGDVLEPKVALQLPASAQGATPSLLFSEDGSLLDVVYGSATWAYFVGYALT